MRRALIREPRVAVLEELQPPLPAADAYLVAVRACAICTWEQRVHRGATRRYPFAGGHEIGGVVARAPDGGLAAGTTVAVSRLPRCGSCDACQRGLDNLCAYLTPGEGDGPGGLCELLAVQASDLEPLPDGCTPVEASLVEPLACVLNSLAVAGAGPGSKLAVVGNGFMGVLHARAASARGAHVTLLETGPAPAGLERAWEGPRRALDLRREWPLTVRAPVADDAGFDAAIVIRGAPASVTAVAHLVRPGGVVSVYASLPGGEDIALPSQLLRRKQIVLTAAASHRSVDFQMAAQQVGKGVVAVADLVYRTYPLARVQEALDDACALDSGRIVVTLEGEDSTNGGAVAG